MHLASQHHKGPRRLFGQSFDKGWEDRKGGDNGQRDRKSGRKSSRKVRCVSQHSVFLWLIRVEGSARNDVAQSPVEDRRGSRMQSASLGCSF